MQLIGLAIAGAFPSLVNYLPAKTHLVSETAPPPSNPKLQECLEDYLFAEYDNNGATIRKSIEHIQTTSLSYLPDEYQERLNESYRQAAATFDLVAAVRVAEQKLEEYSPGYRPQHLQVRRIEKEFRKLASEIEELDQQRQRISFSDNPDQSRIDAILATIARREGDQEKLKASIPDTWADARARFVTLAKAEKSTRMKYRQNVDESYSTIVTVQTMIAQTEALAELQGQIEPLTELVRQKTAVEGLDAIKAFASELDLLTETHRITSKLSRAKRALRGNNPDKDKALDNLLQAADVLQSEIDWRQRAVDLDGDLREYDAAISTTIGMRMQQRLTGEQAESIASCLAVHRDLSLHF